MNAVLKHQQFETIFDHGVTDEEMSSLFFGDTESLEDYTAYLAPDSAYSDIARLYRLRHDSTKADAYIAKIKNPALKTQLITRPCCVAAHSVAAS